MLEKLRSSLRPRLLVALLAIVAVGGIGSYFLAGSNAQTPVPLKQVMRPGTLKPFSLGTAPYQYIAYSGSVDATRAATGIKQYFAAFIVSSGNCTPSWGGSASNVLTSPRSVAIAADFSKLRAAGGEAAISFGGSNGTELATSCKSVDDLTNAYQNVIETYQLKRVDFDIEGATLQDTAGNARRAQAIANIQKTYPDLKVWITLPVHTKGLTTPGIDVLTQLSDHGVVISGINIMAMNYNIGSKDMGQQAVSTAQASFGQLQGLFTDMKAPDIWKAMGITVMVGHNNTYPETFTLQDAAKVRQFAAEKGVGMLSIWNAGRDVACPAGTPTDQASISCSGIDQQPYDFLKALTISARQ